MQRPIPKDRTAEKAEWLMPPDQSPLLVGFWITHPLRIVRLATASLRWLIEIKVERARRF
jgi:hypothetical protein